MGGRYLAELTTAALQLKIIINDSENRSLETLSHDLLRYWFWTGAGHQGINF